MKTYIASPFFNEVQLAQVESIENLLRELGDEFYSPRLHGNFSKLNLDKKMSDLAKSLIFSDNMYEIINSKRLIVNINGHRDIGTLFEFGVAIGLGKQIEILIDEEKGVSPDFPIVKDAYLELLHIKVKTNSDILTSARLMYDEFKNLKKSCKIVVDTNAKDSYPVGIMLLGMFYAMGFNVSYVSNFISKSNLMISESGIKQYKSLDDYNNEVFVDYSKMKIE